MAQTTDNVENPFGLQALWEQGGVVAHGTLIIMVILSLASWYIILTKAWDQRRLFKQYKEVEKGFWTAGSIRDGAAKLTGKDNAFRMMVEDGLRAAQRGVLEPGSRRRGAILGPRLARGAGRAAMARGIHLACRGLAVPKSSLCRPRRRMTAVLSAAVGEPGFVAQELSPPS